MFFKDPHKQTLPGPDQALPGRDEKMPFTNKHIVLGTPLEDDFSTMEMALVAMGCFWGAEKKYWSVPGVHSTAVGYADGFTPNPTYQEVCSGATGHTEVVRVVFDPKQTCYEALLRIFWESHDPTQGMQQGNDVGSQYRSGIYFYDASQEAAARASLVGYQKALDLVEYGNITTEILKAGEFYFAEDYHQQYLAKNPGGYCGLGGTGVPCPGILSDQGA